MSSDGSINMREEEQASIFGDEEKHSQPVSRKRQQRHDDDEDGTSSQANSPNGGDEKKGRFSQVLEEQQLAPLPQVRTFPFPLALYIDVAVSLLR